MIEGLPEHCLRHSSVVDTSKIDKHGLGGSSESRRHNDEELEVRACHAARQDWLKYIGPTQTFASANPYHGYFLSLVLPYTRPERLAISAYLMECECLVVPSGTMRGNRMEC